MNFLMKKQTITILGRKTDLHLLIGCVLLTAFIIINTSCSCMNKKSCSCDKNKSKGNCGSKAPSLENTKMPPPTNVVGADQNTFADLASV
tara:strand:+ start:6329 stop:6598 length:270 start_codon:yes stop_codon:yes gene_type:complete